LLEEDLKKLKKEGKKENFLNKEFLKKIENLLNFLDWLKKLEKENVSFLKEKKKFVDLLEEDLREFEKEEKEFKILVNLLNWLKKVEKE